MCHCGKIVSNRDASGNDALHSCRYSSRCDTDHTRWIPGRGDREKQVCHVRARLTIAEATERTSCKEIPLPSLVFLLGIAQC